jgi:hypothetical protein
MQDAIKEDNKAVLDANDYKPLREAWVASCYLMAATQATGQVWWVRPNEIDTAPDCFAFTAEHKDSLWQGIDILIEIFEWHERSALDLETTVRNKLSRLKADNFIMLCYVQKPLTGIDIKSLAQAVSTMSPKVSEICLVSTGPDTGGKVIKIFPELGWLPIPSTEPAPYKSLPYEFVSKKRTLQVDAHGWAGEGGKYKVDSKLKFTKLDD